MEITQPSHKKQSDEYVDSAAIDPYFLRANSTLTAADNRAFRDHSIFRKIVRICTIFFTDVDELQTRSISECRAQFDQSIIDVAVSQWRRRLKRLCPRTRGKLRT